MTESEKPVVRPANLSARLFGERLKALRKKTALKQSAFAHLMGTSDETLCLIEKGRKLPSLKMLCALSERLEMTLSQLVDFKDAPKARPTINQPLKTFILYLKTKSPEEVKAAHGVSKYFLDKAQAIYLPVRRKHSGQTGQKPRRRKPFVIRDKPSHQ